jgi:S-adenosylmethionine hydrolase
MNTKKYCFIFSLVFLSLFASCKAETDIYIFTDFAAGSHNQNHPVSDWQTAIELAAEGWNLTRHPHIFINDGAAPLDPAKAGEQLATAFPFLGVHSPNKCKQIVVHVIDPGVGNGSQHPRTIVHRKDGTVFIGPDNGTLSLACPPNSISTIWEIDTKRLSKLTEIDLEAGGTFHGRDVFAAVAFLLAADKVQPEDIGKAYNRPELKFRSGSSSNHPSLQFQQVSTSHWNIKLDRHASTEELFNQAFFLAIVQPPFYTKEKPPQLFFIDDSDEKDRIAIFNRKTGNLYIGPNNGVGTSFFQGFAPNEVLAARLDPNVHSKVLECKNEEELALIFKQNILQQPLVAIDLLAHELTPSNRAEQMIKGRIWVDAYGNIKTTLDTDLFNKLLKQGLTNISVELNGVTKLVQSANSFADVPPGKPFIYIGSSGAVGPNPHRSRRYIELSCNGSEGTFGIDLFSNGTDRPYSGQEIRFHFY